ncbi:MAG: hypothetical protein QJR06_03185 [Alicyclobacillaceae bacterium]|nr:hypothetical protein [Alicyclobacillaceae bacterium]
MSLITRCPRCQCRDIGRIGSHQYYCWGCCAEMVVGERDIRLYEVGEDGTLVEVSGTAAVG